ncbi:MAG: protein kinase [Deltaproteobacteria bacterium]|nr:protein kinase [Deltaproteobacteria bacterium]
MSTTIHLDARSIHAAGRSCPSCDGPLTPGDEVCPHCGVSLRLPDPREGLEIGGRYRLDRQVGHGGTSAVYRAHELEGGRAVAVKVLDSAHMSDPNAVARFRDEIAKARDIRHPHVAEILDFGQMQDGTLYMVMELVRGENLADVLRREGPLPEARVIRIMKQVADVVGTAHRAGLVHRDLKPENIMIEPERNGVVDWVLVLDFGIAKLRGAQAVDGKTRTGVLIGTPFYMSPEQCQGKPLDARSDIYALGVVMYELLTGVRPFDSTSDSVIPLLMKHIEERPRPMRAVKPELIVSRELERLVMGALSKDPNWRPANGTELYAALDRVERIRTGKNLERTPRTADEVRRAAAARDRRDPGARPARSPASSVNRDSRRSAAGALATLVVVAALGALVWREWRIHHAPAAPPEAPPGATVPIVRTRPPGMTGPPAPPDDASATGGVGARIDVAASLAQGRRDLEGRRWADASEQFELVRRAMPGNAEAWLGLGRATYALGRPRDAAAYFRRVLELAASDKRFDPFAIQAAKLLDEIDKADGALRDARSAARAGRSADAIRSYQDYLVARPADAPVQLELGRLLVNAGRNAEAEATLRHATRFAPSDAAAHHELGALLLTLNRRTEAIEELTMALDLDPTREDTKRYLGLARAGVGGPLTR